LSRSDRQVVVVAVAVAVALAAGGCMRIYPDPELPDVLVTWNPDACMDGTERVAMTLSTIEPEAEVSTIMAPCADERATLPDVERLQYRFTTRLEDQAGEVRSTTEEDIDLRNGRNARVFAYFVQRPPINFRVNWIFDPGASCESLGVTSMSVRVSNPGGPVRYRYDASCPARDFLGMIEAPGVYTVSVRAIAMGAVVATSPESAPLLVDPLGYTEFGELPLTPCGASCPPLDP
jgi:hypothetical protein